MLPDAWTSSSSLTVISTSDDPLQSRGQYARGSQGRADPPSLRSMLVRSVAMTRWGRRWFSRRDQGLCRPLYSEYQRLAPHGRVQSVQVATPSLHCQATGRSLGEKECLCSIHL